MAKRRRNLSSSAQLWVIIHNRNWGTRFQTEFDRFYCSREPTQQEIIRVLKDNGIRASLDWFKPQWSGKVYALQLDLEF